MEDTCGPCTTKNCGQPAVPESWRAYKCETCWEFITAKKRADEAAAKKRADEEAADIRAKQAATAAAVVEFNRIHAPSWDPNAPENWRLKKARERQHEEKLKKIRDEMERNPLVVIRNKITSVQKSIGAQKEIYLRKRYFWILDKRKQAEVKLETAEKELKLLLAQEEELVKQEKEALAKATLAKVTLAREASLAKATHVKKTANATVSKTDELDDLGACFFLSEQDADAIETADATFFI